MKKNNASNAEQFGGSIFHAIAFRDLVLRHFPELGHDEELNGGDVVDRLNELARLASEIIDEYIVKISE